jgi:hypothetical protein
VEQRATLRAALEDRGLADTAWLEPEVDAGPALDLDKLRRADGLSAEVIRTFETWSQADGWPGDDIFQQVDGPNAEDRAALLKSALYEVLERLEGEG